MHLTVLMMIVTTTTVSQTTYRCSGTSDRRKHRLSRLRTFSRSGNSQTTTAENEVLRVTKSPSANRYQSLGLEGEVYGGGWPRPRGEGDVELQGDRLPGVHIHVASVHRLYRCFAVRWLAILSQLVVIKWLKIKSLKWWRKLAPSFKLVKPSRVSTYRASDINCLIGQVDSRGSHRELTRVASRGERHDTRLFTFVIFWQQFWRCLPPRSQSRSLMGAS